MNETNKNYKVIAIGDIQTAGRVTLHDTLGLTGSEISINELPAGASVPFVHSHKRNEEVYIIIRGKGRFYIDGDEFEISEGNVVRISPAGQRCIAAAPDSPLRFICIQTETNSLVQFTENDAIINETKPSWLR